MTAASWWRLAVTLELDDECCLDDAIIRPSWCWRRCCFSPRSSRFGSVRSLSRISRNLAAIRSGKAEKLEGSFRWRSTWRAQRAD
jgi:hypothetical protein